MVALNLRHRLNLRTRRREFCKRSKWCHANFREVELSEPPSPPVPRARDCPQLLTPAAVGTVFPKMAIYGWFEVCACNFRQLYLPEIGVTPFASFAEFAPPSS